VTEGAINGFLRQQLATKTASSGSRNEGSVQDFRINLRGDRIHIYVAFMVSAREMTLEVEGKLTSKNGLIQFDPDDGRLGSLPIPQSMLQAALQKMTQIPEASRSLVLPNGVKGIHVDDGQLVIERE